MKCKDLLDKLEEIMPKNLACTWDNVGLLIGRKEKNINSIMLGVDLNFEFLERAVENKVDCIITHHPLIFSPIKNITDDSIIGKKIISILQNDISYIAMHTNYDIAKNCMADVACEYLKLDANEIEVLEEIEGLDTLGIGKSIILNQALSLESIINKVKEAFAINNLIYYGNLKDKFEKISIVPGSGKGMYKQCLKKNSKLLISSDLSHHDALDALENGISIIDAGHYGIEKIFIDDMENKLLKISNFNITKYYKEERKII